MTLHTEELVYWLVMHRTFGIGPARLRKLLSQGRLSAFFNQQNPTRDLVDWFKSLGITHWKPDWRGVEKDLTWAEKPECHLLTLLDPLYPDPLQEISAAPPVLYVKGNPAVLSRVQLAMVGSRHPTDYGKQVAFTFADALAQSGLVITSGLALGIDAASHEGALHHQGASIAVLGSGLDNIYPSQHRSLAERLAERGAVISEFPLGLFPKAEHFPRRNRLISGLSKGVFVVESALNSGSLITASYALEQGREIFALPGSIHSPLSKGCHLLIRQGAKCVDTLDHILEDLYWGGGPAQKVFDLSLEPSVIQEKTRVTRAVPLTTTQCSERW